MRNKDAGFGRIVNAMGGVDKLAHLQKSRPHSSLAASNSSAALAIVKKLVHNDSTTETEQS